jgi:hypothetical protein
LYEEVHSISLTENQIVKGKEGVKKEKGKRE